MAVVGLRIVEPKNDQLITVHQSPTVGFNGVVRFRGELAADLPEVLKGVPLYYRWYSSLNPDVDAENPETGTGIAKYSLNQPALRSADALFEQRLQVGSHVIAFAVSDREKEADADFRAICHAGVTGGQEGPGRCVIHVFEAVILEFADGAEVDQADLVLKAKAPPAWEQKDYQEYNRLLFRWILAPIGDPPNRPRLEFELEHEANVFLPADPPDRANPSLSFQPAVGRLPPTAVGLYEVSLNVEDIHGSADARAQASRRVKLVS